MEKCVLRTATLCVAAIGWMNAHCAHAQLRAFGDAEGFGALTTGGRAGSLYVVTNLNDSGAGSFRDAVSQSNRIIVFAVGGYVNLLTAVSAKSNLTILGQTAPGQGIGFMGHEVSFSDSSNDIVEYIRAREGSADTSAKASINLGDTSNMILNHVDAEYSQYDNIDAVGTNGVNNVTIQNSLLADPIKAQQFNMHTEGNNVTYVNNLWVNAHNRNPLAKSNSQYINNVVYNYQAGYTTGDSAGVYSYDILNNYFITGPSTTNSGDTWYQLDSNQSAYASGNLLDSNKDGVLNGSATTPSGVVLLSAPWSSTTASLPLLSAAAAYNFDVAHAGDSLQRDAVDTQVISQVQSLGTQGSIYNTEADTGLSNNGFGTITGGTPPTSSANDGIPDTWAAAHGLSTTDPSGALKLNPLGYTMIEQYAQELGDEYASQTWSNTSGQWSTGTWSSAVPGIYDHALIRGNGSANGTVTISSGTASAMTLSIGGNGPLTSTGEQVTVSTGGTLSVYDTITVGDQNNATLNISGGTVNAYNIILGDTVYSPSATNYTGTINFSSGTLLVSQIALGAGTPSNWTSGGTLNWSGGTLRAAAQLAINVPISMSGTAGTIDSNGFNGTISGTISGNTALTKIGSGVLALTGSNNYSGGTVLTAGELGISTDANIDGAASSITFNGGLLQVNGTSVINLNAHMVNWSTFNGGFDIAASGNTFVVSQNLGTTGDSFTKAGAGTLDLTGTNSYTGGTFLNGGVLSVSADGNLGAVGSPITFAGGTLRITGTTFTNLNNHAPTFSTSTSTIDINTAANVFTISQTIGGSGGITKAGLGVLVLSGSNSFTGDTNISAGTLRVGNALALRKSTVNLTTVGAVLDLNGFNATLGGLSGTQGLDLKGTTLSVGANTESYSGTISSSIGTGSIIKNGSGTWSVTGASTYTGSTTLSAGIFNIVSIGNGGVAGPLGQSSNAASNLVLDGGTLQFTGTAGVSTDRLFTMTPNGGTLDGSGASGDGLGFTNTGAIAFTGTGSRTLNLIGSETHNSFSSALGDPDASSKTSVTVNGTGRWLWESKLSTYGGDTTVQAGTLRLYSGGFLPSGAGKGNVDVNTGATLVADTTTGINALDNGSSGGGTVTVSAGTLTIGNGDATGSFGGAIGGAGGIAKTGAGTETLSGTDAYTAATTISGGVLQFNTAASIGGTGASVTVNAGATDAAGYAIDQTFLNRVTNTSTGVVALAAASANNLNLSSAGANLPNVSLGAIGSVTYSGLITPANSAYLFGGGGGTLTVSNSSALSGSATVTVGLGSAVAANSLNLNVTALQSYTGATTIKTGGKISGAVANGGIASAIGSSSNVAGNLILDGGTLAGTGSTDRLFTLTGNGGTLDNSGGLSFTSSGALVTLPSTNPTLTLTGSSTAHNALTQALADPSGGTLSILKSGTGKWTFLTGLKTYSGDTHITAGTLETLSSGALSPNSNMVLDAGATLDFHDEPSESINALVGAGSVVNSFSGSHTDSLAIGSNNGGGAFSGTISSAGTFNLVKNGSGTQILSGANAFTGTTTINQGTLQLGASNTLPTTSNLVLAGGTLATGGLSDNFGAGTLQVTANSHIDLGSGSSVLHFAASSATPWNGTLTIDDWNGTLSGGGPDQIFVGSDATGLSAYQLTHIVFTGSGMPDAIQLASGAVVPGTTLLPGDVTGDNQVDVADVLAMMTALVDIPAYESTHNLTDAQMLTLGDVNQDGHFNNADIQALISDLRGGGGSNAAVPEPTAFLLAVISAAAALVLYRAAFRTGKPSRLSTKFISGLPAK